MLYAAMLPPPLLGLSRAAAVVTAVTRFQYWACTAAVPPATSALLGHSRGWLGGRASGLPPKGLWLSRDTSCCQVKQVASIVQRAAAYFCCKLTEILLSRALPLTFGSVQDGRMYPKGWGRACWPLRDCSCLKHALVSRA